MVVTTTLSNGRVLAANDRCSNPLFIPNMPRFWTAANSWAPALHGRQKPGSNPIHGGKLTRKCVEHERPRRRCRHHHGSFGRTAAWGLWRISLMRPGPIRRWICCRAFWSKRSRSSKLLKLVDVPRCGLAIMQNKLIKQRFASRNDLTDRSIFCYLTAVGLCKSFG